MQDKLIRLEEEDTKEGKRKTIPLADSVYRMLIKIPRPIYTDYVFLYHKRRIGRNFSTALKSVCKDVGILRGRDIKGGFIFHDLRHTFVTNMRKAGVSKSVRMSITGHAPKDIDDRYNTVDIDDQKKGVKTLEVFFQNSDHSNDQALSL